MIRQCAWCLRQIDSMGEPLSSEPLPKDYEATHGMCHECALQWLEAVLRNPCWLQSIEDTAVNEPDSGELSDHQIIHARSRIEV
jgi:hypothetical protein